MVDGGNQVWGDQWTIPRPAWFDEDAAAQFRISSPPMMSLRISVVPAPISSSFEAR